MMQPYVLEPKLTITVGLYTKPKHYADQEAEMEKPSANRSTKVSRSPSWNSQAWYYHEDKTIVLCN